MRSVDTRQTIPRARELERAAQRVSASAILDTCKRVSFVQGFPGLSRAVDCTGLDSSGRSLATPFPVLLPALAFTSADTLCQSVCIMTLTPCCLHRRLYADAPLFQRVRQHSYLTVIARMLNRWLGCAETPATVHR